MKMIDKQQFENRVREEKPLLVEFSAQWCSYCRRIAPAMEKVVQQWEPQLDIFLADIDREPLLAEQEQIEVVPTLVVYKGGKVLGSLVAPESKARIDSFLQEVLA